MYKDEGKVEVEVEGKDEVKGTRARTRAWARVWGSSGKGHFNIIPRPRAHAQRARPARMATLWRATGVVVLGALLLSLWATVLVAAYASWRCGWQLRPRASTRVVVLADPQMVGDPGEQASWIRTS